MDELLEALTAAGYRVKMAHGGTPAAGNGITVVFTRKPAEELTEEEKLHG